MEAAGLLLDRLNIRETFEKNRLEDSFGDAERISELLRGIPFAIVLTADIINMSGCPMSAFDMRISERYLPRPFEMALEVALRDCKPESRSLLDCLLFMNTYEIQDNVVFKEHGHPSLAFLSFADSTK
jgi:hypothetical protein